MKSDERRLADLDGLVIKQITNGLEGENTKSLENAFKIYLVWDAFFGMISKHKPDYARLLLSAPGRMEFGHDFYCVGKGEGRKAEYPPHVQEASKKFIERIIKPGKEGIPPGVLEIEKRLKGPHVRLLEEYQPRQ